MNLDHSRKMEIENIKRSSANQMFVRQVLSKLVGFCSWKSRSQPAWRKLKNLKGDLSNWPQC